MASETGTAAQLVRVALDVPLYRVFDYRVPAGETLTADDIGRRVRVPFGSRPRIGIVIDLPATSDHPLEQLREIEGVCRELPGLPADWFALCQFCADYYQAPLGEVMLSTLPASLRRVDPPKARGGRAPKWPPPSPAPELTAEQRAVLAEIDAFDSGSGFQAYLLHGVTGSGKTEVYLRLVERALAAGKQALLLVPEINLTPQLEARVAARFPDAGLVSLHSELADAARTRNWRAALDGSARIVLGTRLAVFAPLPELGLIVVDEEHDASFKQQDGMRYSARDVAVFRAHTLGIPIVLGSATPSLESWANATDPRTPARYRLLTLRERAVENARLPQVQRVDTRLEKLEDGLSGVLLRAIGIVFLIFILWAAVARLDEVTRGEGKVIPSKQLQVLQSIDGGLVSEILVHEGDVVQPEQDLIAIGSGGNYAQAAARAAAPAQPRASRPATASKAEPQPLPCRVVGAELRAGERSVSVAPANGDFTPDQLQVLLPGDAVGPWRLQAIEGNAAVFQAGDQTRRVAIP